MQFNHPSGWLTVVSSLLVVGCSQTQENIRPGEITTLKTEVTVPASPSEETAKEEAKKEVAKQEIAKAAPASPSKETTKEEAKKEVAKREAAKEAVKEAVKVDKPQSDQSKTPVPASTKIDNSPVAKTKPTEVKTSDTVNREAVKVEAPVPVEDILKRATEAYNKKDFVNAAIWYQKAAQQGIIKAQYRLGEMYYNGEGLPQNLVEAEKWYRMAAQGGEAMAQYRLGKLYYALEEFVIAKEWILKSAQQGVAQAQELLGFMYYSGKGAPQQFQEAFAWSSKAAEQGLAIAQNNIAQMYFKGEGVAKNLTLSYQWVSLAADQGNPDAIKAREFFISQLSPAQLAEAARLAQEWRETHK